MTAAPVVVSAGVSDSPLKKFDMRASSTSATSSFSTAIASNSHSAPLAEAETEPRADPALLAAPDSLDLTQTLRLPTSLAAVISGASAPAAAPRHVFSLKSSSPSVFSADFSAPPGHSEGFSTPSSTVADRTRSMPDSSSASVGPQSNPLSQTQRDSEALMRLIADRQRVQTQV